MPFPQSFKRGFILSLVVAVIVYLGLIIYGESDQILDSLKLFQVSSLVLILALVIINLLFRFIKWGFFLRLLGIVLPARVSLDIFLSGLVMTMTPGKTGELMKSYLLREYSGVPMRRTVSVVFAERFTDFISVVILAAVGTLAFPHGQTVIAFSGVLLLILLALLLHQASMKRLFNIAKRWSVLHRLANFLATAYESLVTLIRPKPLIFALGLSLLAWFAECLAFFLVLDALSAPLPIGQVVFIYAFATLLGALLFLPGGLGATEGSLAGLTVLQGAPKDVAVAATIIIRACTLWLAVALGFIWFLLTHRRLLQRPDHGVRENITALEHL